MASTPRLHEDSWPKLAKADTQVVLTRDHIYELPSDALRSRIGWFRQNLTDSTAAEITQENRSKARGSILWRVELDLAGKKGVQGLFVINPLDSEGNPTNPPIENEISQAILQYYDNLLRAACHMQLDLNSHISVDAAANAAISLLTVAEPLGGIQCVSQPIEQALIVHGQALFHSISKSPCHWAELGLRLQSEFFFAEAICHLVGRFNLLSRTSTFLDMDPSILALARSKAEAFSKLKERIELRIMGHYPSFLARPEPETANVGPGSVTTRLKGTATRATTYAQDIFSWMALNLFRHFIGQNLLGGQGRTAVDGGFNFYMRLAAGGNAYIDHEDIEHFCGGRNGFPFSSKGRTQFEEKLEGIKESIKPFVVPLVRNHSALDVERFQVPYLTCLELRREDFPWLASRPHLPVVKGVEPGNRPTTSGSHGHPSGERQVINFWKQHAINRDARVASTHRAPETNRMRSPISAAAMPYNSHREIARPAQSQNMPDNKRPGASHRTTNDTESRRESSTIPFRDLNVGKKRKNAANVAEDATLSQKRPRLDPDTVGKKAESNSMDMGEKAAEDSEGSTERRDAGEDEQMAGGSEDRQQNEGS